MKNFLTEKFRKSCRSENDCRKVFPITNPIEKKKGKEMSHSEKTDCRNTKTSSSFVFLWFFFLFVTPNRKN